ncbi:hypothetical protein COL940_014264 [Colletotrichum noveboracense]|nr:hypothetical protein COL940_014264 [Colletotrichum noveboracense]
MRSSDALTVATRPLPSRSELDLDLDPAPEPLHDADKNNVITAFMSQWLDFLIEYHPGYGHITINQQNLDSLPNDGDVGDRLLSQEIEADTATRPTELALGVSQQAF